MILRRIPGGLVLCVSLWLAGCGPLSQLNSAPQASDPKLAQEQYRQAMAYAQGVEVPQDYSRSLSHFLQSARYGSHNGAYMAGMSYLTGRGTEQNLTEAARWLDQAARGGHVRAQYQLSVLYLNGAGVEQDKVWAMFLASLAAHKGHQQAAFDVGVGYARGMGLPNRPAAAWYWFSQAEFAGIENASKLRRKMQTQSTQAQRDLISKRMRLNDSRYPDRATAQYMQQQLKRMGYLKGVVDGVWGKQSAAAYEQYTRKELLLTDVAIDWSILELMRH